MNGCIITGALVSESVAAKSAWSVEIICARPGTRVEHVRAAVDAEGAIMWPGYKPDLSNDGGETGDSAGGGRSVAPLVAVRSKRQQRETSGVLSPACSNAATVGGAARVELPRYTMCSSDTRFAALRPKPARSRLDACWPLPRSHHAWLRVAPLTHPSSSVRQHRATPASRSRRQIFGQHHAGSIAKS